MIMVIVEDYNLIITDVYSDYKEWNTPREQSCQISQFRKF